jgi:hypothetical protein
VNFYHPADMALLGVGTTVVGTVDGKHVPSAGLIGFTELADGASDDTRQAYAKLRQVELTPAMTGGDLDAHGASTNAGFVAEYVAPWVLTGTWASTSGDAAPKIADPRPKSLAKSRP